MIVLPELENIMLFIAVASVLIIMPGPAVLYIMAKSIEQGYKAGLVSVLGIGVGGLIHVIAAGVGLSAILVTSATAFSILKYLGALYLIYLGIRKLVDRTPFNQALVVDKKKRLSQVFYEGMVVNILNPKTAIFFFAFLPQFVNLEKGGTTSQLVFLGLLFIVIAMVSDSAYVLISGKLSVLIKSSKIYAKVHRYLIGSIYIFLGLLTLTVDHSAKNTSGKR